MVYYCKEKSELVKNFLLDYMKSKGIVLNYFMEFHSVMDGFCVAWDINTNKPYPIHPSELDSKPNVELSLPIFLKFIDERVPKVFVKGQPVTFHEDHVQFGCESLKNEEIINLYNNLKK